MKIGPDTPPTTAISAANAETIVVRGFDLARDLIGSISFSELFWLLLTAHLPTATQRKILDAVLVAIAEHGLVPSVQAARLTLAAAPESLQGAVAAGLLGCGSVILGAAQSAGEFLHAVEERRPRSGLDAAARELVQECRANRRPIPGFGHPLHKAGDPRVRRLYEIAESADCGHAYIDAARAIERVLPEITGKDLRMNVSVAIPAVLLDVGYPILALRGVPLLARAAGLVGHLLEEQTHPIGFRMSQAAAAAIEYNGPAPDGFIADES